MGKRVAMTLRQSDAIHGKKFYKDCRITEIKHISDRYVLVEVEIPQPYGGYHEELVKWDVEVEVEQ